MGFFRGARATTVTSSKEVRLWVFLGERGLPLLLQVKKLDYSFIRGARATTVTSSKEVRL